jgi:hypothetical protein
MTTKRIPKLNKAQVKAYADKYRSEWYERLCKLDLFGKNENEKDNLQVIASFIKSVVRPDIDTNTLQLMGRLIDNGINRTSEDSIRLLFPNYGKNVHKRINEPSIADSMKKSFENELMINPYMTGDEIHAFAETHWQLMLLRENLAESWTAFDAERTFK